MVTLIIELGYCYKSKGVRSLRSASVLLRKTVRYISQFATVKNKHSERNTIERKKEIARELAGLWADRNDDISVEETVRMMRRRRSFDY